MKKILKFLYFFICGVLLFSVTASAYIDPSAMTYIIQLVAGVAIAAGAAAGFYFRKARRMFSKFQRKDHAADNWEYDEEDTDETGLGDYDIEPGSGEKAAAKAAGPEVQELVYAMDEAAADMPIDKYDETGGEGGLLAENRELRRLLAEERQKVEVLKKSLHICTAPKK